ncbi:MAG: hypothetical protein ACYDBQ_05460 [Thermoplasmatota archaeon]
MGVDLEFFDCPVCRNEEWGDYLPLGHVWFRFLDERAINCASCNSVWLPGEDLSQDPKRYAVDYLAKRGRTMRVDRNGHGHVDPEIVWLGEVKKADPAAFGPILNHPEMFRDGFERFGFLCAHCRLFAPEAVRLGRVGHDAAVCARCYAMWLPGENLKQDPRRLYDEWMRSQGHNPDDKSERRWMGTVTADDGPLVPKIFAGRNAD